MGQWGTVHSMSVQGARTQNMGKQGKHFFYKNKSQQRKKHHKTGGRTIHSTRQQRERMHSRGEQRERESTKERREDRKNVQMENAQQEGASGRMLFKNQSKVNRTTYSKRCNKVDNKGESCTKTEEIRVKRFLKGTQFRNIRRDDKRTN